jgi:hypothetical protein
MSDIWLKNNKRIVAAYTLAVLFTSSFFILFGSSSAYGVELYTENDSPFGVPLDVWMSRWWTWWVTPTIDEATPKPDGCLIHDMGPMVALMDTVVSGKPHQVCEISTTQGIMIPLWTAFWEDSISEKGEQPLKGYTYEQLSIAAREIGNLGAITSIVNVDGRPVAKLDVVSSLRSGTLDYKINSMDNVTELYSKGFNVTIPEDTHFADQNIGTWRSGAHGWFVFLKPLPPGDHIINYNVGVTGTGPNDHSSEISYDLKVK